MPPDPPRMSCYAAELPSETVHATLLIPYWPYHPSDASYGPGTDMPYLATLYDNSGFVIVWECLLNQIANIFDIVACIFKLTLHA